MVDFLKSIGIEIPAFIAGASGVVATLDYKNMKMTWTQKFIKVLSGGAAANYLTPLVENWLNSEPKIMYGVSFLIGCGGMKLVEFIMTQFFNKIPKT